MNYIYIYIYPTTPYEQGNDTRSISSEVLQVQSFPSPKPVVIPCLKNPVYLIIYP